MLQLAAAQSRKEKGNAAYKAGRISRAIRQYTAAYETANSISETDMAPHPVMGTPSSSGAEGGEGAAPALSKAQIMAQARVGRNGGRHGEWVEGAGIRGTCTSV